MLGRVTPVVPDDTLRMNSDAVDFVRTFFSRHKSVAAICDAGQILIEAGVVGGHACAPVADCTNAEGGGAFCMGRW